MSRRRDAATAGLALALLVGCGGDAAVGGDAATAIDARSSDARPGAVLLREEFGSGPAWPSGWTPLGGVAEATMESGRGRLVPVVSSYTLARMGHTLPAGAGDVEVTFTLAMADAARQGVGVYVRQNGGYLQQSPVHGGGYAVFVEAFRGPSIGVWRERDGNEEEVARVAVAALADGAAYQVRFRCAQDGASTALAAKLWPAGTDEPAAWTVTATDATAALQDLAGGIAVDAWNTATPGGGPPAPIFVDDLDVRGR